MFLIKSNGKTIFVQEILSCDWLKLWVLGFVCSHQNQTRQKEPKQNYSKLKTVTSRDTKDRTIG